MRRRVSIVLFCLLVPVAIHAAWDYFESRRLFAAVDALRQQGEPVSRNALGRWQRPTEVEELKAARYYSAAGELAYRDWTVANRAAGGIKQLPASQAPKQFGAVATSRTLPAEAATSLEALVHDQADALSMMDRAAELRFSKFQPHEFEDYPRNYSLEHLAEAAAARTILLASRGDSDAAARSLWSTLKLRRAHVRTVPWLGEHTIDLQFLLEHSSPSSAALAQLQRAFHEREKPNLTLDALRERRAIAIESLFTELYGRRTDPLTPSAHTRWVWQPSRPWRPWIARQAMGALEVAQEAVMLAQQPWPSNISSVRDLASRQPDPRLGRRGVPGLVDYPRYIIRGVGEEGIVRDAVRLVYVRAAIAALAVERFRRDRDGARPNTLQEVVPAYLPAVPQDPFTGQPLKYIVDANRFVVYSLGPDQRDDGAQVGPLPVQVWKPTTKDVGLEIRRQE